MTRKIIGLELLRTREFYTHYVHDKFKDNLVPWIFRTTLLSVPYPKPWPNVPLKMFTGFYRTTANFYWRNVFTYSISVVNEGIGFIISSTKINIIFISAMLLFTCSSLQQKSNILLPKNSISLLCIWQKVMYCSCRTISWGIKAAGA